MHLLLLAATLLRKGGKYWIFSVFHFHYALRGCKDVGAFVEREEEYRRWFSLPPFALTVRVGFRGVTVRTAAALARQWRAAQEDGHRVLKTRVEKAGSRGRYHRVFLDLAWEGDARPVQVRSMSRDLSYEPFVGGVEDDG